MTWYPFQPTLAIDVEGNVAQSGSGQIYATTDTGYTTPLTVVDAQDSPLATVEVSSIGVTPYFKVEDHGEVMWKSGSLPAVSLLSAGGFLTAAEAAQAAAEAAEAAATDLATLVTSSEDANVAGFILDDGSDTRAAIDTVLAPDTISVAAYGATGDGVTDDTTAIQAAVTAGAGKTVVLPPGTYLMSGTVTVGSHTTLRGLGATVLIDGAGPAFDAEGTEGAEVALTVNATAGARTVTAPGHGLTAGSWIIVASDHEPSSTAGLTAGEMCQVDSVAGDVVTLRAPLFDSYATTDAAHLVPVDVVQGVHVEGLRFTSDEPSTTSVVGVSFGFGVDMTMDGCHFTNCHYIGLRFRSVTRGRVTSCTFVDALKTGLAYGVTVGNACVDIQMADCSGSRVRHVITIGGGAVEYRGIPHGVHVSDSVATQCTDAGFDVHPGATDITFADLMVHGSSQDGIVMQGTRYSITGCQVRGSARNGIYVQALTEGGPQGVIRGNVITDSATNGIYVHATTGYPGNQAVVEGNIVDGAGVWGIYTYGVAQGSSCRGWVVQGNTVRAAVSQSIYLRDINDVVCNGNVILDSAASEALYLNTVNGGAVTGNTIASDGATRSLRLVLSPGITLVGNRESGGTAAILKDSASDVGLVNIGNSWN